MKRYPAYKDSGVDWIGDIPRGWELWKVSRLFNKIGSGTTPKAGTPEYYEYGTIPWINTGDLNDGYISNCSSSITQKAFDDHSTLKKYEAGTLLVAMYGATIGKIAIINFEACTNQACCALVCSKLIVTKFAFYWFIANKEKIINLSYGGGQPNISQEIIRCLKIPICRIPEQQSIVRFLDYKTGLIDSFIANRQKQIELLKEQKAAIINKAVTKGINPKAKMKPSGIEWIGEIPEGWQVVKLKFCLKSMVGGGTPSKEISEYWNGDIPWVSPKDMKTDFIEKSDDYITAKGLKESSTILIKEPSVLIVVRSGILKHTLPIAVNTVQVTLNQDLKALIPNKRFSIDYLFELFRGVSNILLFNCIKVVATVDSVETDDLLKFLLPVPTIKEQTEILAYIKTETSKIDTLISKYQKQIGLMQEYRTSLISQAVTGKIDVREWQPKKKVEVL